MVMLKLRHLHLPYWTPYPHACAVQDFVFDEHRKYRALVALHRPPVNLGGDRKVVIKPGEGIPSSPSPTLLTFTTPPTYTIGRRELNTLTPGDINILCGVGPSAPPLPAGWRQAFFYESRRGGQTTFHGPGQLVAFLVCDLRTHSISPREYVRTLEDSIISLLKSEGLVAHTTANPGVWIGNQEHGQPEADDRKIASVGVHLQSFISRFGIALNESTDLGWFDRIVMCGLPGRKATNMSLEMVGKWTEKGTKRLCTSTDSLASGFAKQIAQRLKGVDPENIDKIEEDEVWKSP